MRLDEAARAYLGVPFRHQGRNPAIGLDCIGLVVVAGRDAGYSFDKFDSLAYGRDPVDGLLEERIRAAAGKPVSVDYIRPGDIVTIDYKGATRHVCIVGEHRDGLSLIHTNGALKRVTEAGLDDRWARRITGVYRPRRRK